MPEPYRKNDGLFLYVGPTQYALDSGPLPLPPDVRALPPVGRGDVPALVAAHRPGVLAIVDGGLSSASAGRSCGAARRDAGGVARLGTFLDGGDSGLWRCGRWG